MWYECEDCGHSERLWNSRDGVTPFIVSCQKCGGAAQHVAWHLDERRRNHQPKPGERMFVDLTPERARQSAATYVERFWDGDPDNGVPPMREAFPGKTKEEAAEHFATEWCSRPGAPHIVTVGEA